MPPESLCDNLYSSKTDSFALGVLLYFLVAKRFPWKGKNKNDLVDNLKKKKYSKSGIVHLPPRVKHLISGLIEIDSAKRIPLIDCDFEVFLHLGSPVIKIEDQLHRLRPCYTEQLQLCQYINSILKNFDEFTWTNSFLKEFIVRHLSSLTFAFEWQNQSGLNSIRKSYSLPEEDPHFHSDEYYWLNNCLKDTIKVLTAQFEPSAHIML